MVISAAAAAAATLAAERYPPHPLLVPLVPTFCDRTVLLPIEMFRRESLNRAHQVEVTSEPILVGSSTATLTRE